MKTSDLPLSEHQDACLQPVMEWLAQADQHSTQEQVSQLGRQMHLVRAAPIPIPQRAQILDIFYTEIERLIHAEAVEFHKVTLPVSRRLRNRTRELQKLLGTLVQDYLTTLSELYDPQSPRPHRSPEDTFRHVLQCIVWQIHISHLVAAPTPLGLWLELHSTFSTARRLGPQEEDQEKKQGSLERLYLSALLTAIAQPASFNSHELEFISECLQDIEFDVEITDSPPKNLRAVFWIDPKTDSPAHAIARRLPPTDSKMCFFSCKALAESIDQRMKALSSGTSASQLGLPPLADTPVGQSILQRLLVLWGNPGKRTFPRRHQSYRARMVTGVDQLWQLHRHPASPPAMSEWMVTNESPNGYAIMHITGPSGDLQVGNIVALQAEKDVTDGEGNWHLCIVRWAISENPEHIELGLQLVASRAMAAEVTQPSEAQADTFNALLIPEMPPLRPTTAIILKSGQLASHTHNLIAIIEKDNLEIREFHPTHLEEQTNRIEVFSVAPDVTA